jgi:hypothetical protein
MLTTLCKSALEIIKGEVKEELANKKDPRCFVK